MTIVSEIKLIRTDTTLDLSQKAEKVCLLGKRDRLTLSDARCVLWLRPIRPLPDPKTYVTCDSHVVPHRSTEQAQGCLTSEFGWDPVLSPWYERMMRAAAQIGARTVVRPARHKPIEALAA